MMKMLLFIITYSRFENLYLRFSMLVAYLARQLLFR